MTVPPAVPPGWYADPTDPTWQRWWDGRAWTQHVVHGRELQQTQPATTELGMAAPGAASDTSTVSTPVAAPVATPIDVPVKESPSAPPTPPPAGFAARGAGGAAAGVKKPKPPLWRRWWVITAAVLVVLVILSSIFSNNTKKPGTTAASDSSIATRSTPTGSPASTTSASPSSQAPSPTSSSKSRPKVFPSQLNKWVVDNHMAFKVTKVEARHTIGDSFLGDTAHGKFILVWATIKNTDHKEHDFNGSSQTLVDTKGNSYDVFGNAWADMPQAALLNAINPGVSEHVVMVFETPTSTVAAKVTVAGGWLTTGTDIWLRAHTG